MKSSLTAFTYRDVVLLRFEMRDWIKALQGRQG